MSALARVIGGTPQINAHELQTELEATGSVDGLTVPVLGVMAEGEDTLTMAPVKVTNGHGAAVARWPLPAQDDGPALIPGAGPFAIYRPI